MNVNRERLMLSYQMVADNPDMDRELLVAMISEPIGVGVSIEDKTGTRWSDTDDRELADMVKLGYTNEQIGERLNRTSTAIRDRKRKLWP